MIESWFWEHFRSDEQIEAWEEMLERPHHALRERDVRRLCLRSALDTTRTLIARQSQPGMVLEAVPAGWDDATLLAEMLEAVGAEKAEERADEARAVRIERGRIGRRRGQ